MKIVRYYYYRVYKYFEKGDAVPFFSTFLVIILFLYFNLITLINFMGILMGFDFTLPVVGGMGKFWPLIFIIPLFALFYVCLKKQGIHDRILEEFQEETKKKRISSGLMTILYFIASIGLSVASLWIREKIRGY